MNITVKTAIILSIMVMVFSCQKGSEYKFDKISSIKNPETGQFYKNTRDLTFYDEDIKGDVGYFVVNETDASSKKIILPLVVLKSFSESPKEPVFILYGGPGITNMWKYPPTSLLENHDIVMVGYRGIDGSVNLKSDRVSKAFTQKDIFTEVGLRNIGEAFLDTYTEYENSGINMNAYSMINVIDDIEAARLLLGYNKINLYSQSYGTRVAYLYGLKHPSSIKRSLLESANPPGGFVYDEKTLDDLIYKYGEWWNENPVLKLRTDDLPGTMKKVIDELPDSWLFFPINRDKIRIASHAMLFDPSSAPMIFDAYVSAAEGDYSAMALLTFLFDKMMAGGTNWGDNMSKVISADYDEKKSYSKSEQSIIGAPFSELFESLKYGGWPSQKIDEYFRVPQYSNVETLILQGELDFSTPHINVEKNLIPYLTNGTLESLPRRGHYIGGDWKVQNEHRLSFFRDGSTDTSAFEAPNKLLTIDQSTTKMAKKYLMFAVLGLIVIVGLVVLVIILIKKKLIKKI